MVSPIEWGIFNLALALAVGVTLIHVVSCTSRWLFRSLADEIQDALKRAAGLAAEDARLAKEYRELMKAFTAFAIEREQGETHKEPVEVQCTKISPDKKGLSVSFAGMPIRNATRYWGMRVFYRGNDVTDMSFAGGAHWVNPGDILFLNYTLGRESFKAKEDNAKPLDGTSDIHDPLFDPEFDLGGPRPSDLN